MNDIFSDGRVSDLEAEWAALSINRSVDIDMWERTVSTMTSEYMDIRRAGQWKRGPSDFFGVLRIGRKELSHCAMIAWLLDPEGRHGLGRAFLDCLIVRYLPDVDHTKLRVRSVETEVPRLETRADIVVWGVADTLIFEAKVDSGEGWRQCDRLFERFSMEPGSQFVFLTPSGGPPTTATGLANDAFISVAFSEIADCLEAAIESRSESKGDGREMARNYLLTLRNAFS